MYVDKDVLDYREIVIASISLCQNNGESCDGTDTSLLDTLIEAIEELVLEVPPYQLSVVDDSVNWVGIDHVSQCHQALDLGR